MFILQIDEKILMKHEFEKIDSAMAWAKIAFRVGARKVVIWTIFNNLMHQTETMYNK